MASNSHIETAVMLKCQITDITHGGGKTENVDEGNKRKERTFPHLAAGHSSVQGSNQLNSIFDLHISACLRTGPYPLQPPTRWTNSLQLTDKWSPQPVRGQGESKEVLYITH